jgi:hypothetical protein
MPLKRLPRRPEKAPGGSHDKKICPICITPEWMLIIRFVKKRKETNAFLGQSLPDHGVILAQVNLPGSPQCVDFCG